MARRLDRVTTPTTPATRPTDAPAATTTPAVPIGTPATRPGWTAPTPAPGPVVDGFTPTRPGAAAAAAVKLAPEVFLSASGNFVSRAGQDKPLTAVELGDTLTRAAQSAEKGVNVFSAPGLGLPQKEAALASLTAAFATGRDPAKFGGNKDQALQTRASVGPLMLDLARSLDPGKPDQKALQDKVIGSYLKALETEPHGQLRNFLLFDLDRIKGSLPAEVRPTIDALMREVAPLAPPYEDWFKNGNTNFKLEYYVGDGFWEEEVNAYVTQGFKKTDNPDGTVTLTKHLERERTLNDGTTQKFVTDVELHMHNGPDGLFDQMNDPTVAGAVYSGHANYGREVPSHVASAPPMVGAKAFFSLQCGGKGTHNAVLDKFPDMQVVSSKNSSYGYQDRATLMNSIEGIANRLPWSAISTRNTSSNSDNYYFPTDTLIARRSIDGDRDGKADAWDRVLNVNPFHPQAEIDAQLTAKDPQRPVEQLDGRALTGAVLRFWRMAGYNQWADPLKDQGVVGGGFFAGKKTDPLFKVQEQQGEDGKPVLNVQVNSQYAHASEEVLGAALHYELGKQSALKAGLPEADAKAAGLLMAAKALDIDTGSNDSEAWKALLKFNQLPETITHHDAMEANHLDEHLSAGGARTVAAFQETLKAKGVAL
ncbi:MAG: hypothetical protein H6Q89_1992 [Myxococcaceae bacterium]|nr:hypothetical protein [Myxococcaceae bacterium]